MRAIVRWLFGRTRLNRFDHLAFIAIIVTVYQQSFPWWAALCVCLVCAVASTLIEGLVFGGDYHAIMDRAQRLAEGRK